ncbi:MAG: hypothetical protein H0X30_15920 [Anaerolineae bacterium]|nr:hypothetical protein [Anaerolineae bacterium]
MSNLISVPPTDIVRRFESFVFYYGVKASNINQLPGGFTFSVVYSPVDPWGWEFVRYQVFSHVNGIVVLERRILNSEEIAYFELLIATSKI